MSQSTDNEKNVTFEAQEKTEKVVEMFKNASTRKADLSKKVTREELIGIISQIGDNINDISQYLMQDLNTLYSTHVFPFQIQLKVLEDLLVEAGIVKVEDLNKRYAEHIKEMQQKARALKEDADGEVRVATEAEDREETSKKVLKVLNNSKKDDTDDTKGDTDSTD